MLRRRQVRLSYPQPFVDLTLLLALRHGRRNTAKVLTLPLSTVYRWLDDCRHEPERRERIRLGGAELLEQLMMACQAHGFDLRARIGALEPLTAVDANAIVPGKLRSILPAQAQASVEPAPREVGEVNPACPPELPAAIRSRVALARHEIDRHYYSQLSCEMLAGIAGMSRFHFIRTFKTAFSVAPYHYLMQVRIEHAKRLLGTTQQPLGAVAAAVGFDSQSSMCKAFRNIEGVTLATFFRGMRLGSAPPPANALARVHAAAG